MGFLTVGRRFLNDQNEIIDDRIDVVGRGLLGLTVACARCHDHKFDPIPTEDYYSLYGVFASSVEPDDLPRAGTARRGRRSRRAEFDAEARERHARRATTSWPRRGPRSRRTSRQRFSQLPQGRLRPRSSTPAIPSSTSGPRPTSSIARRLRGAIVALEAHARGGRRRTRPGARPPGTPSPRCRRTSSPPRPASVRAQLLADRAGRRPARSIRWSRGSCSAQPPASMDEVVARYVDARSTSAGGEAEADAAAALAEPEWESLRQAVFGPRRHRSRSPPTDRRLVPRPVAAAAVRRARATRSSSSKRRDPAAPARAMVLNDAPKPVEPHVFVRGNPGPAGQGGPAAVPPGARRPDRQPFQKGSGRLELAQAIVDPSNPLTARVLVNRVWHWHFGQGLVDHAQRLRPAERPALAPRAARLPGRRVHRRAAGRSRRCTGGSCSRAPTSSAATPGPSASSATRRTGCSGGSTASGSTSRRCATRSWPSRARSTRRIGGPAGRRSTEPPFPPRRTVYGFIDRQNLDGLFRTFDFAIPDATSPRAVRHDRAAAGPLPDEQPVRASSRPGGWPRRPLDRETSTGRAGIRGRRAERLVRRLVPSGSLGRSSEPPRADAREPRSSTRRQGRVRGRSRPGSSSPRCLMLTNEFMFVD